MMDFIKAMIALYLKRYNEKLFFCIERNKGEVIEYVYHDCSVPKELNNEERKLLMKFEDGYFFDSSFMVEDNFREMHLDLIRYYVLKVFNKKDNRRMLSRYAWTYIPSNNEKIINVYGENSKDCFMKNIMFKEECSEKDEEYVIV